MSFLTNVPGLTGSATTEVLTWETETDFANAVNRPSFVYDEIADHAGGSADVTHSGYNHGSLVEGLAGYWPFDS